MKLRSLWMMPIGALAAGLISGWFAPGPEELLVLDVGQGDCAVVSTQGIVVLIDDGPGGRDGLGGQRVLKPALRRAGIDHVDLVLLSHPDADHVGGTPEVIRECPHAKVAISKYFAFQPKLRRDLALWGLKPSSVIWLSESCEIKIGQDRLSIRCPAVRNEDDDNMGSMFVQVRLQNATAMFSGDAPTQTEESVMSQGSWKSDVLHVGHHGSRTSTGASWIEAVQPSIAVISCGVDNPYGHPHRAVLQRLAEHRVQIDRTDHEGDIKFVPVHGHFQLLR